VESKQEQIIVALQTAAAGIRGDGGETYWYTVDRSLRAPGFSALCLDSSLETVYVLSPEDVGDERADSCSAKALVRVNLTAIHKFAPSTENPFLQEAPIRWTVQTRLERDVKKLIRTDETLGGLSQEVRIPLTSYSPNETYWEGWAGVFIRLEIKYHYPKATP
jgi:hypothetical protein